MKQKPFKIAISDKEIIDLQQRLSVTRLPGDLGNDAWEYGTNQAYLNDLLDSWQNSYDWRIHEEVLVAKSGELTSGRIQVFSLEKNMVLSYPRM